MEKWNEPSLREQQQQQLFICHNKRMMTSSLALGSVY